MNNHTPLIVWTGGDAFLDYTSNVYSHKDTYFFKLIHAVTLLIFRMNYAILVMIIFGSVSNQAGKIKSFDMPCPSVGYSINQYKYSI